MANTGEEGLSVGQRVRSWASWLSSYVFGDRGIGGHATGVVMVVSVALIWVVSSEFIQYIFGGDIDFSKPFFLTYFNTTLFASYLLTLLWKPLYRRITAEGNEDGGPGQWWPSTTLHEIGPRGGGVEKEVTELIDDIDDDEDSSVSTDTEALIARMTTSTTSDGTMPMRQMAKLAMFFCPLWFVANYTFNLGLMLTSVSSSSTISTMTGLFTLIIGVFVGAEAFSLVKVASVTLNIVGVALISYADVSGQEDRHSLIGDLFSLLSAFGYGCYTCFIKVKLEHDNKVDMFVFFGFLGLFNLLMLWPIFFVLHYTGIEEFVLPSGRTMLLLTINGAIGTVLSDYLWARAVLLTTPLIATLAISLSIPFSLIADTVLHQSKFTALYFTGIVSVFTGFIATNVAEVM